MKMQWMSNVAPSNAKPLSGTGDRGLSATSARLEGREPVVAKKGPNPFGWNYYSPGLFYSMTFIGSFMLLGIFGILFTEPAALMGAIPATFPIIVAVRQWILKGEQGSNPQ